MHASCKWFIHSEENQSDQASLREAAKRVKLTGGCRRNFFVPPGFAGPRGLA
jgi:hypothetical protein